MVSTMVSKSSAISIQISKTILQIVIQKIQDHKCAHAAKGARTPAAFTRPKA